MDQPILNPSIPYLGSIDGKFSPNRLVRIKGTIREDSFNINLQCGPVQFIHDIALQISVYISNKCISFNSTKQQEWNEEILRSLDSILKPGDKFEIVVLCQLDHYKIIINGQQFCNFPHRIPHCRISHLSIDGDVSITQISFETECGSEFRPLSRRLLSSPVNEHEHTESLLLPNNSNSSLPPSYETTIKNNSENVELQPLQPMRSEHVPVHRLRTIPFVRINNVRSNYWKLRITLTVVALIIFLIVFVVRQTHHEDSSSTSSRVVPFRIRRIG